nr:MAG TPA: hypothetical protein [Caudoviricetes sp.]
MRVLQVVTYFGMISSALARKGEAPSRRGYSPAFLFLQRCQEPI